MAGRYRCGRILGSGATSTVYEGRDLCTGAGVGTPHYMAPEQAVSARDVRPVADVWSVGALLYRLVTGRLPFEGENAYEVVLKACTEEPRPVTDWVPTAHPMLVALIHRCLVKAPELRIEDAAMLLAALREVRAGTYVPIEAAAFADPALAELVRVAAERPVSSDGSTERAYRSIDLPRSRKPLYLGVSLCLAALALGGALVVWSGAPRTEVEPAPIVEPAPRPPVRAEREPIEEAPIEPAATIEPMRPAGEGPKDEARATARRRARAARDADPTDATGATGASRAEGAIEADGSNRAAKRAAASDAASDLDSTDDDAAPTEPEPLDAPPDEPDAPETPPIAPNDAGVRPPPAAAKPPPPPPPPAKEEPEKKKKKPAPFLTF